MSRIEGKFKADSTAVGRDVPTEEGKIMAGWLNEFNRIEEKGRCLRVRFLDWLSAKLADWSVRVKKVSDGIHSPCVIKIPEKNK